MASDRPNLAKQARVKLDNFLGDLEELHDNTSSTREDWCLLLVDLRVLLEGCRFDVVKEYEKNGLKDISEYLYSLSKQLITFSDQIDDIYDELKLTIESTISYLPRTYFNKTIWDMIPFISCFGFLLVFLSPEHSIIIAYFVAIIGLVVTYYCKLFEENKNKKDKDDKKKRYDEKRKDMMKKIEEELEKDPEKNESADREKGKIIKAKGVQFRIFAAVFGIIAALAITSPVEALLDEGCESIDSQLCLKDIKKIEDWPEFLIGQQVILISSFFAIGILFYHGGILVLSSDLARIIEEGNKIGAFVSSLIIFLEGIVLFVAANNTDDLTRFSLWIFVLLALDNIWVLLNLYARIDTMFQWLHLNTIMLLFLLFVLLFPYEQDNSSALAGIGFSYWALLIVFVLRTVIDYKIGWKSWTKIPMEG